MTSWRYTSQKSYRTVERACVCVCCHFDRQIQRKISQTKTLRTVHTYGSCGAFHIHIHIHIHPISIETIHQHALGTIPKNIQRNHNQLNLSCHPSPSRIVLPKTELCMWESVWSTPFIATMLNTAFVYNTHSHTQAHLLHMHMYESKGANNNKHAHYVKCEYLANTNNNTQKKRKTILACVCDTIYCNNKSIDSKRANRKKKKWENQIVKYCRCYNINTANSCVVHRRKNSLQRRRRTKERENKWKLSVVQYALTSTLT